MTGTCTDTSLVCYYPPTSLCSCVPCNCAQNEPPGPPCARCLGVAMGTPIWFCDNAPVPASPCPAATPNEGSPCDVPGMSCPSSACNQKIATCTNGTWQWGSSSVCPVCASPDTPIATPAGDRPIASLAVGDLVYSVDGDEIRAVPVVRVGHTPVVGHQVVRVRFANGRVLEVSPGHPTADGRTFGDLVAGGALDGAAIASVETIPYAHPNTYDILPASSTGDYFAAGMRVGSTLSRARR